MKTWICRILALSIVIAGPINALQAAPLQTLPTLTTCFGKTYENCRVLKRDPDGVYISHACGMAKLLYADMTEKDRAALGYDAEKEATYNQGIAEKHAKLRMAEQQYRNSMIKAQAMAEAEMLQARMAEQAGGANAGYATGPSYDSGLPLLASTWNSGNPYLPYYYGAGTGQGGFSPYAYGFGRSRRNVTTSGSIDTCNGNILNTRSVPGRYVRRTSTSSVPFATPPLTGSVPPLAPAARQVSRPAPVMGRVAVGGGAGPRR